MDPRRRLVRPLLAVVACALALAASACGGQPATTLTDAGMDMSGPAAIGARSFGDLQPWPLPIEDYRDVAAQNFPGTFLGGIHDLAPFEGRLWIGYGDANNNLATFVPIEFRSFSSPDAPQVM